MTASYTKSGEGERALARGAWREAREIFERQLAGGEMLRVCRPGGTVGMLNFTPEGLISDFFAALADFAPPPPPGVLRAAPRPGGS